MQGTLVRFLVQEDSTRHRATEHVGHSHRACALEPMSHNYQACVPMSLAPVHPHREHTRTATRESPPKAVKTQHARNKQRKLYFKGDKDNHKSEVSQKEKHQYSILTHIYGI